MVSVAAAVIVRDQTILIAQRPSHDPLAYFWEFPGGKIEPGETAPTCLEREIWEELNLKISVGQFFASTRWHYDHIAIELSAYWAELIGPGTVKLREHAAARWVSIHELGKFSFAPADRGFVARLQAVNPES